ncbi:permease prefix domain 1-containing protein [Microbacterium sp. H1-D42]|uniref:permease prefix domain 1-containing protein n=1 Tax=Microbacterium sp. H1-D42 TaxID=2925844 RepID=UPI001F52E5A6|nr:permease prefix domain 1-containing protein [Microbacterium sp. H1-D42]UNK70201.1 permease prefix domain 1-containing protein [Microbacterium sp. H1-D42]
MTATLTDRYVAATIRSLPPNLQVEVRDELDVSISDAIDARTEAGETAEDAERAVLTELGDPGILAAGYADRPLHLIGPKYYLTWWRLLKVLVAIVPACAFAGVAIAQAVSGAGIGSIIGQAIAVGLSVLVHVTFWTTLIFAIFERTGADTGVRWSVDQLPEDGPKGVGRGDLIASLVMVGIFAGLLLWDHFRGFPAGIDEPVTIINPELWPWWMGVLFALLAAEAVLAIVVYAHGRWTKRFAIINAAIAVCVMSLGLTALGRGVLFNAEFVDALIVNGVDADARAVLAVLTGVVIAGVTIWDGIDGFLRARRARIAG